MKAERKTELLNTLFKYIAEKEGEKATDLLVNLGFTTNEIDDLAGVEYREDDDSDTVSKNHFSVPADTGVFDVLISNDDEYPGVDVEFISENDDKLENVSRPRILLEQPVGKPLRILIWDNPDSEDYTREIIFDNAGFYGNSSEKRSS